METFKKRQKEMRRLEKQRDKAAKRIERKLHPGTTDDAPPAEDPENPSSSEPTIESTIEPATPPSSS